MTTLEFVKSVKAEACDSAVDTLMEILDNPPGRRPDERLVALAAWYRQLSSADKECLHQTITRTAHVAVFGVLAILDGVRAVEGLGPKGEFELYYVKGSQRVLLNDPKEGFLHDLLSEK
jgi:hypothetical protein